MDSQLYVISKDLADKSGWTLAAWIRKAMEEKVSRDTSDNIDSSNSKPVTRAEIQNMIRDAVRHELKTTSYPVVASEKEGYVKQLRRV